MSDRPIILRHWHWLLTMNDQSNWRNSKMVLRGTNPIASAPDIAIAVVCRAN